MEGETGLLLDVSIALGVALAGGWIATRMRLSSIVGYIVAGIAISPFTAGYVGDVERLRLIADIGIVLLLFGIGVQFSVAELLHAGPRVIAAASAQVMIVLAAAWALGLALGWSHEESFYIGGAAAITSSVVAVKLLDARGDVASDHGRLTVAWSIVQDLWAVVLIVALGAVSAEGGESLPREAGIAAAKAAAFLVAIVVIGLRVMPYVLGRVAEERSRELFFLAIALLAIGTALASEYVGLSLALGAFIAGLVVSESDLSHRVLGELLPARDVFAVLFFVSVGMLIDPGVVADEWPVILGVPGLIVIVKSLVNRAVLTAVTAPHTATLATIALLPAGEFSFLLARSGLDEGSLDESMFSAIITAAALSIVISPPALAGGYAWVQRQVMRVTPIPETPIGAARLGHHAVIAGYGEAGRIVASVLSRRFELIVAEEDARAARDARGDGFFVAEGNPTSAGTLERMRLDEARVLIITLDDAFSARLLAERAREINPHLDIAAGAAAEEDAARLARSGVTQTVIGQREAALELGRHALQRFGVSSQEAARIIVTARGRLRI